MTGALEINGKKLLSIKDAAKAVSYSRDHITRLARENKIVATHIGRNWYIDINSLKSYEEVSKTEQEIKQRHLSEERRRDLQVKEVLRARQQVHAQKGRTSKKIATAFASLALTLGLVSGVLLNYTIGAKISGQQQIATVTTSQGLSEKPQVVPESSSAMFQPDFEEDSRVRTFSEADSGILLLPQFSKDDVNRVQFVRNYFSDPVEVVVGENGETFVVMVDENGNPIGEPIPFVSVPINQAEK